MPYPYAIRRHQGPIRLLPRATRTKDNSYPMRTQDNSHLGQVVPSTSLTWTIINKLRTQDDTYPGQLVLRTTPTQNVPKTNRTHDKSYPGQAWDEQSSRNYDKSIEYLSIARNFHHDGRHNISSPVEIDIYSFSPLKLGLNFEKPSIWSLQISKVIQLQCFNFVKPLNYASEN